MPNCVLSLSDTSAISTWIKTWGGCESSFLARLFATRAVNDAIALAIAAEYLPRLDRVFGFLHDDLTRRTLTSGLLVEMLALDPRLLSPDGLLARLAIFTIESTGIPLGATVRIDRGFLAALVGEGRLDARIRSAASEIGRPAGATVKRAPRGSPEGKQAAWCLAGATVSLSSRAACYPARSIWQATRTLPPRGRR